MKLLTKNRRAAYDYELTEHFTAGIVLSGDEVKSIKAGHASLKGSFIFLQGGEAFLANAHVTPYANAYHKEAFEPIRNRKLLLHRRQLELLRAARQDGQSIVPTALGFDRNLIKLELGLGRGKKRYDKRETIKARDTAREAARNVVR